jgi:hypothetical protein
VTTDLDDCCFHIHAVIDSSYRSDRKMASVTASLGPCSSASPGLSLVGSLSTTGD